MRRSKLERFFMLGVIPFVFTAVLTVALLMFLGVDVGAGVAKVGQQLPFVGKYFAEEDNQLEQLQQQKIEQLAGQLEEQQETIDQLRADLQAEQEKSAELQSVNRDRAAKEQIEAEEQMVNSYRQVAKKLEGMFASRAASIIMQMEPEEALLMMHLMKSDSQSQLLSKLPPEQAARYTLMLAELLRQENNMSLVQASREVAAPYAEHFDEWKQERNPEEWAVMFASMQPANAAAILDVMDEAVAVNILSELDVSSRAAILSSLEAQKASQFSQQLVDGS